jgi:hypothetical protein
LLRLLVQDLFQGLPQGLGLSELRLPQAAHRQQRFAGVVRLTALKWLHYTGHFGERVMHGTGSDIE